MDAKLVDSAVAGRYAEFEAVFNAANDKRKDDFLLVIGFLVLNRLFADD